MAGQQIDIVANLLMKVDGAEAGINKLKNSLSKLKMPDGLENSFKKSFANLDVLFARYRSQVEKGFSTKADITNFAKTGKALDAELDRISKHFTELTGRQIDFKVNSTEITKTEQELEKLIAQRNELAKNSIRFEITGAKEGYKDIESLLTKLKEVAGNTKTGQYASGALDFLKQGDLQSALVLLEKASVSCKRLSQEKKDLFAPTGLDMSTAIKKIVEELTGAEGKFGNVNTEVAKFEQILADLRTGQIKNAGDLAQRLADDMLNAGTAAKQANGAMQDFAQSSFNMNQQLSQLQQSTQYFFGLRNMINLLKRGLKEAISTIKELDAAMTETAVVTKFSVGDMWAKLPEYTANANALGATVKDMYEATTLYYQQGLNTQQAMGIATETMKMARIGGLEAADATDKMTAALRGFNMEINETSAQRVNDVYSNLAAKTASNTEELGTAMQRTASIAASAGMSFEGTAAFLAQAIETTREPAENLGTAMKTIVARFTELKKNPLEIAEVDGEEVSYNKVDTALQSIGVSLKDANGQFRALDEVFLDISQRWNSLTQTQQRYVATTAAGSRQQSRFIAMMSNYDRTMQLMEYANNSAGASQEQFGKTLDSLEAKLNKFQNAWKEFLMGIMNDSWTKGIVTGATEILDVINKITDLLSGGGKHKGIKSFLSLYAAFTGLKFAGSLVNAGIGKLGGFIDPTTKRGALSSGGNVQGIANKITSPIVAKLNELIAVTKGQKLLDKSVVSSLAAYKNATNLLRMPQTMGTARSTFGQLSDDHAYAAYISSPGTVSAMKRSAMGWLNGQQLSPDMKKTGEQLMASIFKGMQKKQIPIKKGADLIGKPQLWGKYLGTETAQSFSDNFIKAQKAQREMQTASARQQAWWAAGQDRTLNDAEIKAALASKDTDDAVKQQVKDYYKLIRQQQKAGETPSFSKTVINPKQYEQLANQVGMVGSKFTAAGYSIQMFGSQLGQLSPSLAGVGNLISRLGIAVSTFGMGFSGLGKIVTGVGSRIAAGRAAVAAGGVAMSQAVASGAIAAESAVAATGPSAASAFISGFGGGMSAGPIAAIITAVLVGAIALVKNRLEKKAQEAGQKVREQFEEGFTKKEEKIQSLEGYNDRFNELAKGVDEFGHNVNLSAEDYDEYLNISRELKDLSPSLIAGYNAEGEAIIKKGKALEETIEKLRADKQETLKRYTLDSSIDDLIGEYKTSDAYKDNKRKVYGYDNISQGFSKKLNALQKANAKAELDFDVADAIEQLGGGSVSDLSELTATQSAFVAQHYNDILNLVKEKNSELTDEAEEGLKSAFGELGGAIEDVTTEGQPIIDAMQMWMGMEGLDAIGINLGEEFGDSFNQGVEGIMLTGLTEGWSADEFKANLRDYSNEWESLAGSTSEYSSIMEEAKDIQDEYLDSMGSDDAIENYNRDITESCNNLIELANNTDTATEAGRAFQQQCIAQANALRHYATEGGMALSEALNTATDDIQRAESALDNFNEATKTDLFTAAEGMRSIYDKAFETYKDSYGGEYEKHFEGKGDRTAWEAGRSILDEDVLESIPDGQALQKKLKEWEPALREGEEGWYEFKEKIVNDQDIQKALKNLEDEGVQLKDGFLSYIPEDQWANVAKAIGISEEMLTSMLNKGRQFADIDFTNWGEVRHNLETSNVGLKGTSADKTGQRKLYVKESTYEAALADANYKPEEYEGKKQEGRDKQNLEYLKKASEYNQKELKGIFRDEMGFKNLNDLISGLVSTGDFTKDEIQDYAKQAGYEGMENFDTLYNSIAEAIDNPELYKQTSVLEKISGQIALLDDANTSADTAATDRDNWAAKFYGKVGEVGKRIIDSEADYFARGRNADDSSNLSVEQYEATKKSLEAQQAWAEQQANMAEARANNASTAEEAAKWQEVADQWRQDAENIGTYLTMGAEAFAKAQQENQLVQDATQKAVDLNEQNASNEEIKKAMIESAQKMADAQMTPDKIAAAINQSYGTNLTKNDIAYDKDGQITNLTIDESQLQQQLDNLTANIKGNITDITFNGAALASGQNNPNSMFHRHGTMAKGSRRGYVISGRPTLTGEEGEELVWEPKRNQAYMVGSNGPQFANISKDAVVWNAAQTKRIKKNSKIGSFGTGARGISHFGTMAGGNGGGLKIPGLLEMDAKANIQETTPPVEKPTIPVKAQFEEKSIADSIEATATVTKVIKSGQVEGEPISVKATATTTKVKKETTPAPKETAGTQVMKVTANTSAAQAQINKLINLFNKTYTLKYKASGPTSISVPISANFTGSWKKTVEINKSGAKGINNHISHYSKPFFGSAARGKYGTIGPNNKGGLTLTGEKGFEIAWLPNENRSMILGANGPQMLKLPSDAVIYTHEQSKKILKQQAIPAGSHAEADIKYRDTRYDKMGSGGGAGKSVVKNAKKAGDKVSKTAEDTKKGIERVLVWWDNAGRRADAIQRRADANQKTYEKYLKEIQSTLQTTGTIGKGDAYLADMQKLITEQQRQYNKATKELKQLDTGKDANGKKIKANKTNYKKGEDNVVQISYDAGSGKKKKTKTAYINTAGYIKYDSASGAYQVDQSALDKVKNESQRKAIADAVKKELDDRVSKRNKAEDEMRKAEEAIEKMGEELYNTFFKWETELTKIWNITQKIEATEARIGRAKGYSELLTSQLSTGLAKAGKDFAENSLNAFKTGIDNQRKQIEQTLESVGEKRNNLSRLLSLDDEKKTLENIQKKLSGDVIADYNIEKAEAAEAKAKAALDKAQNQTKTTITANKKITKISRTLKKGSKGSDVKDLQRALNQALGTNLAIDGKFGSKTQAAVKKFQKKYGLSQTGKMDKKTLAKLANVTGTKKTTKIAGDPEVIAKAQEAYDKAIEYTKSVKEGDLNETEKLGYETYAEALEKGINAQARAWDFLTVQRRGDGTIDLSFNTEAFEEAKQNGEISEELGKSIQDYVKELVDSNKDLNEEYEKVTSLINDLYGELETLQDQWIGYANDLWDMSEAETKKEIDNAKKLNDSLTKALKDLLDDVKKKLDQRRQQEDNAKTERDISQKQQRLAALRADTSGGHQVEIAQLEKEIAEAQQNYQRTLEDQLLEKLQQQADIAEQQRERQIELQETIAEAVNNAALVDMWMADPATFEQEIWEAYKAQNDYDKKPQALQEDLLNKFNVMFDGLLNNQEEQAYVQEQIEELQKQKDILDVIKENVETLATNAETESVSGGEGVEEGGTQELLTQVLNKLIEDDKPKTTSTTPTATNTPAKKTTNNLKYGKVSAVSGTLKKGSSGKGVKALQDALNKILGTKLAVDGKFGSKTFAAVKKFQKKYGLSQDGVVGSKTKAKFKALGYSTGGLADYTGPAWLDGTPSKPELVLSATDTKNFLALRDVLSGVMKSADSINSSYGGDATYEININVDHLNSDYDVDKVAERVKKIIVKDSSYRNVTQVRNFR